MSKKAWMASSKTTRKSPSTFEHSLLVTFTLCLLAAGAVMVYSASSAESLLGSGDASYYLKRYVFLGGFGLFAMHFFSRVSLDRVREMTMPLLLVAAGLLLLVKLPGVGITVNGATRWLGVGPIQFQPSEVAKLALVLYAAATIASRPERVRSLGTMWNPLLLVVGGFALLVAVQPDLGTDLVIAATVGAVLVASGAKVADLAKIAGVLVVLVVLFSIAEPYRMARLTSFFNPEADPAGAGFQAMQAKIAIGSGGLFGVGPGESVQKIFYLPEAHTDMILAVIGEELGLLGMSVLIFLYGGIAFAGLRAAHSAQDAYAKLLAIGVTSLILCQAILNFFAVMGMAPLTGVPLPFISYGNSNMIVLLAGMGLLMNVARGGQAARMRVVEGGRQNSTRGPRPSGRPAKRPTGQRAGTTKDSGDDWFSTGEEDRDRGRRDSRPRRTGTSRGRRAAG